ncbi:ABC transporter permease [Litchfieldella qijiaojingensis]|uniref:ABC transporter permease n=1 Tax=Litchfieldella qijiaojingensis TaxID=980347 RepID=A0ABQ2Z3E7_9GAMM|nr:FtsX-like permease family protein [Halomonas qijiaojingensis]GGY02210.1 ABC transporter permease [Halomonas qijiaojingensis]
MNAASQRTAFLALFSHYRRHPGQLAMLLVGLWVASALWSGVQAINASARDSYARAEALFSTGLDRIERRDGLPLTLDDYLSLRLAGAPVSPLVTGELELAGGSRLEVMGIDPLTLPEGSGFRTAGGTATLADFLQPPYRTRLAPDTLASLTEEDDTLPPLADGRQLPPLELAPELPPGVAVMDIAAALELLERDDLSRLLVAPEARLDLPQPLVRSAAENLAAPGQLTDSFHLNLTAMALLALVVGLLIVHAALSLTLEQRLGLMRTLRALGVSGRALVSLLLGELLMLGVLGAALGILSGVWLAQWLLPDVAASLQALYGERVGSELALPWHYWLGGLAVTLGGLLTAGLGTLWRAARLDVLGLGRAQAWRGQFLRQLRGMALAGGLLWLIAGGLLAWLERQPPAEGLTPGFVMIAAGLLGSALWLPPLLAMLLAALARLLRRRPLAQWALADLQLQLPRLSVAMMALLLALSANLGVGSMVGGFRLTFLEWLDQRLVADLYLRPPPARYEAAVDWLEARDEVATLLPRARAEATLLGSASSQRQPRPVNVYGVTPHPALTEHWPLLASQEDDASAWQAFARGAAMINEQLALATGLAPGQWLRLSSPTGPMELPIAAIYPDYGNPRGEVMLTAPHLSERFQTAPDSIGIVLDRQVAPGAIAALRRDLSQTLGIGGDSLIDQREIQRRSTEIFERTFAITRALNTLTLGVAGLALLSSLLAQTGQRRSQLAPLWALGVSRGPLVGASIAQLGGAALVTAALAVPLGLALTWCLVAVINVAAFGWRLPLHVFPGQIAATLGLAVGVALLAALLPAWRLWRTSPRTLLTEFDAL